MGVVEAGAAPKAGGVEESIQAEGGILKARIILKNRSIKKAGWLNVQPEKSAWSKVALLKSDRPRKVAFSKPELLKAVPQKTAS